jgi:NAD(P)-dependent dehydrogenase (short-subunit alcohol dehydrogenase family)
MSFKGKTVLVTGGTSGIGRAAAEKFAATGAVVVISGRDEAKGRETASQIESGGGSVRFVAADLADPEATLRLAQAAGDVDVLVRTVLEVNVTAPFALTAALVPGMLTRGRGSIVNVSTMVASFGNPGMSAYGASKAALELLTKAWAAEYGPSGIRVNAVAPGPTITPATSQMGEGLDQIVATVPLGRAASADEIASAIVFLASDDASYINGAILAADGGRTAV